ncbi:transcriptional regulator, LysR family [Clostridium sp. DL-VIII]|uniref:LysR family transcriptional regulator n=1 Tax=Clostridium sp. DL-VIII TaxID=641107 RepID=UPI00023AF1B9|nr:LysR family transcriptional regulator [Clostridium sp. DL-VIII]EHI97636.1 transcriptional regulator, LysR family [Clostridium sp. DL-VIII]
MYNRHLQTFIQVADSGSFLKASEVMHISANAITKQINLLENHLDIKLFHRSTQGLVLTDSGKLIYNEAKKMIRHSNNILVKAKELEERQKFVVHIGVSLMNPSDFLLEQWNKASVRYPNIRLDFVPFEDSVQAFINVLDNLGKRIDLIACPYQTSYWGDRYNYFHLKDLPMCISYSRIHRLATKTKLTIEDLHEETLIMMKRGLSANNDMLRDCLEQNHPQVQIKDIDFLDYDMLNQIATSNDLIVAAEYGKNIHPLLTILPVDWQYTMPYGLIYTKEPRKEVLQFIIAIGEVE